jgi:hypothetical protein
VVSFAMMEVIVWRSFTDILNISIKKDVTCWLLIIGLFLISTFIVSYISLPIKIVISILILVIIGYYFNRNFKKDYYDE